MLSTAVGLRACSFPPRDLFEKLKNYGQEHVFASWSQLSPEEKYILIKDLESLDFSRLDQIAQFICGFRGNCMETMKPAIVQMIYPAPEDSISTVDGRSYEDTEKWRKTGLMAISKGKLAVVLLSGGQGTRLGSSDPKGCYNIGLPSGKSLFQLQAERILRIQKLASDISNGQSKILIPWYIMTSGDAVRLYFKSHEYFGLESDQVTFFHQGMLPCLTNHGKFIMQTASLIAKSPDGNGGVYSALKSAGLLEEMTVRGIEYVDIYGVDNALVRVADPIFLGYFIDKSVAASAKVVQKVGPDEKVGVFVRRGLDGPVSVIEYSEIDRALASQVDERTGRFRFCWSNVCLHMFTLRFLKDVADILEKENLYHVAEKMIPSIDGYTLGVKMERFVFDAFLHSPCTSLFEVVRGEEFGPVKNANGSDMDSPDTARSLLLLLHARWVRAAGGSVCSSDAGAGVEVSPLVSYSGEGMEAICCGRTFDAFSEISP